MLGRLILGLATPAPWSIRRQGHVAASVALQSRSRRCRIAWAPHLAAARAAIGDAMRDLPAYRTVMVLGSGLLDDVPLDALARTFARVVLVDAVHPWPARRAMRRHPNVAALTADLASDPLDVLLAEPGLDLVVSANLLSQLPLLPVARAERRGASAEAVGKAIVEGHLDALGRTRARVCLVTDVRQSEEDRGGRAVDTLDLLHGVVLPEPDRRWDWELAPFGEVSRHRRLVHRVHAYPDWHRAVGLSPKPRRAGP